MSKPHKNLPSIGHLLAHPRTEIKINGKLCTSFGQIEEQFKIQDQTPISSTYFQIGIKTKSGQWIDAGAKYYDKLDDAAKAANDLTYQCRIQKVTTTKEVVWMDLP